jgi:signal transduction histidine kinase
MDRKHSVLVIEDNPNNVLLLSEFLEKEGFEPLIAEDGEEGIRKALDEQPDLILLDVMLPRKDGFEVCEKLKERKETRDIPVIFVTAKTETRDRIRGLDLGAVDYVLKPFDGAEVIARVRTQIKLREMQEQNAMYKEALIRNQRLSSIGTLVNGISHNFNNLLSIMVGYTEIAYNNSDKSVQEELDNVLETARRMSIIVSEMNAFARANYIEKGLFSLDECVEKTAKFFAASISRDIKFSVDLNGDGLNIRGDYEQISQVILSLLTNAREAIGQEGCIFVKTSAGSVPRELEGRLKNPAGSNDFALVTVTDNGFGIPEDELIWIFDPFYTTKQTVGAGFGLSVAYGVVTAHGGIISVKSRPGKGSRFEVFLPVAAERNDMPKRQSVI